MPSRPTRTPTGTAARLDVERLGERVVPTITNPQAVTPPAAVVGTALPTDLTLAKFESPDPAAALSATVAINGGTAIVLSVVPTGAVNAGVPEYAVRLPAGSYTPTAAGPLGFAVTIRDAANTTAKVTATGTAKPAPLVVVSTNTAIAPTEGATFTTSLAVFKAADPAAATGDFTVTVDWGDGTAATAGTVTAVGGGRFEVAGTHAYAAPKAYEVRVSVADPGGDTLIAKTTTKPVTDAATTPLEVPPLATSVDTPLAGVRVATFTDANPLAEAADYTATVTWGDGTTAAATVVSAGTDATGVRFAVLADHRYTTAVPAGTTLGVSVKNADSAATLTGSAAVTVSSTPITPVLPSGDQQYVRAVYLKELGRPGTATEIDGWVAVMGGAGGRGKVANAIARSVEARTRLVGGWYETYLDRSAKGGEEAAWVAQLLQNRSEEQVLAGILGSQEFYNRAQKVVAFGTAEEKRVQALYTAVLGRTGSAAEVTGWVTAVPTLTPTGVAAGFLKGVEYRTDLFESYYLTILHRPPDVPGLTGWVNSPLDVTTVRAAIQSVA
jgi:hypothetical protein